MNTPHPTMPHLGHVDDGELKRLAASWRAQALCGDREAYGIAHALEAERCWRLRDSQLGQLASTSAASPRPWWKFWSAKNAEKSTFDRFAGVVMVLIISSCGIGFTADARAAERWARQHSVSSSQTKAKHDRLRHKYIGQASVYAEKFAGKKMADGTRMNPRSDNAASKTLPLGTTAKVTNLQTGQSAKVTIRDRGPHVKGRILDVSPSTAHKIGITRDKGVAKVHIVPIAVPKTNDSPKSSTAAHKVKAKKTASAGHRK